LDLLIFCHFVFQFLNSFEDVVLEPNPVCTSTTKSIGLISEANIDGDQSLPNPRLGNINFESCIMEKLPTLATNLILPKDCSISYKRPSSISFEVLN
jgi:hypothetical protein